MEYNFYSKIVSGIYAKKNKMKVISLFIACSVCFPTFSHSQTLKLHYGVTNDQAAANTVIDESGGGYNGTLKGSAKIATYDNQTVIDLGNSSGYVDMGSDVGTIIASLSDFTMRTKIYIPTTSTITDDGNFIWTFSNAENILSNAIGCMFLNAKQTRYAISKTNYSAESSISRSASFPQGSWEYVTYVQSGTVGKLYINGLLVASGDVTLLPKDIGATNYNWLGRSCYLGDKYLTDAKIADFRIYDGAFTNSEIATLDGAVTINSNAKLKINFDFTSLIDKVGNETASLGNNAQITTLGKMPVLSLGANSGYLDLGSGLGQIIAKLDSFTVSTNIYIPSSTTLGDNGNFIWTFANSTDLGTDQNGAAFLRANDTRYAISKTYYTAESQVTWATAFPKGVWKNVILTQDGSGLAKLYVDGDLKSSANLNIKLSNLGSTKYNFLGRSCYNGDVYLKNAYYNDFRIYEGAISEDSVASLSKKVTDLNKALYTQQIDSAIVSISFPNAVRQNIVLPSIVGNNVQVSWTSSDESVLTKTGTITRPKQGDSAVTVTLTGTFTKESVSVKHDYSVTIASQKSDQESVEQDVADLTLSGADNIYESISLPYETLEGSIVSWKSSDESYLSNEGKVIKLSAKGDGKKEITLTATAKKGTATATRNFTAYVAENENYACYLFAYFSGNDQSQEQIHYALSTDGYTYTPLNNSNPVISSDTIAIKKAVRDPHILRGNDGKTFYMVATDMKSSEGWASNDGIVLLKSTDLINWTHTAIDFPDTWPSRFDRTALTQVWAPQTIYDPSTGKYMVYYTIGESGQHYIIYYSYANDDFTTLTEPKVLYDHGSNTIDPDIVYANGAYNLFFKTESNGNGIQKATSPSLLGTWTANNKDLQQTTVAVEGSGVFKKINSDQWILMYDCYTSGYYQFCKSTDLNNFTWVCNSTTSSDFSPRHGTVIPITSEEAERLVSKWPSTSLVPAPVGANNKAVRSDYISIDKTAKTITIPVEYGTDLSSFDPQLYGTAGTSVTPSGEQNFASGAVNYTFTLNNSSVTYSVKAQISGNPILTGFHADPEVLYSKKTGRFYIYPTTDGYSGWAGYSFNVFSSPDLVHWEDEGTMLDLSSGDVSWATGNAWAPCIEEKETNGNYKYYFYYSGNTSNGKEIGVAVSTSPTGPFTDSGAPLVTTSPTGGGQQIDSDVFTDPISGKSYLYWGNSYMAGAELNDDMVSLKDGTTTVLTPAGGTSNTYAYREGTYVFYRKGLYYFLWSVDDTGSSNYHVAYGTSTSPLGPITVAANPIVIKEDAANEIYGTGHNAILQIPNKDEWYIVYHRINKNYLNNGPGYHREVCIDHLYFNEDGSIKQVIPTNKGVEPVTVDSTYATGINVVSNNSSKTLSKTLYYDINGYLISENSDLLLKGVYIKQLQYTDGSTKNEKFIKE